MGILGQRTISPSASSCCQRMARPLVSGTSSSIRPEAVATAARSPRASCPLSACQERHCPLAASWRIMTPPPALTRKTWTSPAALTAIPGSVTDRARSGSLCGLPVERHWVSGRPVWYCTAWTTATVPPGSETRRPAKWTNPSAP
ncbi:hypothetical protein SBADM41S_12266 [Streptomyces badius]